MQRRTVADISFLIKPALKDTVIDEPLKSARTIDPEDSGRSFAKIEINHKPGESKQPRVGDFEAGTPAEDPSHKMLSVGVNRGGGMKIPSNAKLGPGFKVVVLSMLFLILLLIQESDGKVSLVYDGGCVEYEVGEDGKMLMHGLSDSGTLNLTVSSGTIPTEFANRTYEGGCPTDIPIGCRRDVFSAVESLRNEEKAAVPSGIGRPMPPKAEAGLVRSQLKSCRASGRAREGRRLQLNQPENVGGFVYVNACSHNNRYDIIIRTRCDGEGNWDEYPFAAIGARHNDEVADGVFEFPYNCRYEQQVYAVDRGGSSQMMYKSACPYCPLYSKRSGFRVIDFEKKTYHKQVTVRVPEDEFGEHGTIQHNSATRRRSERAFTDCPYAAPAARRRLGQGAGPDK